MNDSAPVKTYRELFAVPEFRLLFVALCLSVGGGAMSSLALGTITYAQTGSAVWTGLSLFGGSLVTLLGSMFLQSASDLLRPRTAIMVGAAVWVGVDAVQAVPGLPWPARFALLTVPYLVSSATSGSSIALVADILPADAFVLGRATLNIAVGVMQFIGYATGGLLLLHLSTMELFVAAAVLEAVVVVLVRSGVRDHPPRAAGPVVRRTLRLNAKLLGSPVLRPVYLASWVPNGLIVGCEALFIPFGGTRAGYLMAAAGAGMLTGDIVVGRFVSPARRERLIEPLRLLLAAPYLVYLATPTLPVAAAATFIASAGYAAGLPLQERLVAHTEPDTRGHVLGLRGTGMLVMQAVGAIIAGLLTQRLGSGRVAAAHAMGLLAIASVLITLALAPGLRRSRVPAPMSETAPAAK